MEKGDESRAAKKEERDSTRRRSKEKKARRKYRALEVAKNGGVEESGMREQDLGEQEGDEEGDEVPAAVNLHEQEGEDSANKKT